MKVISSFGNIFEQCWAVIPGLIWTFADMFIVAFHNDAVHAFLCGKSKLLCTDVCGKLGVLVSVQMGCFSLLNCLKVDSWITEWSKFFLNFQRFSSTFLHLSRTMSQRKQNSRQNPRGLRLSIWQLWPSLLSFCWWARVLWLHCAENKQQCAQYPCVSKALASPSSNRLHDPVDWQIYRFSFIEQ